MSSDIYVKLSKKAEISDRSEVYVSDVAEDVCADMNISERVRDIKLMDIQLKKSGFVVISVTDVIKAIKEVYPKLVINSVGASDVLIKYYPVKKKLNKAWFFCKTAFISIVFFFGSSTAIMSFHTDAQLRNIFINIYKLLFGVNTDKPLIIEIPYAFGLVVGIIVFFNHFAGKNITEDPTPIEVQVSQYETQTVETLVDIISERKKSGDTE
ncbi:MAG: stage V sporulation protein AA [Clostridiales bacterium]|jgi:stage V sporulation protein AA|nr:stage V sporulation protein AA [Clostridiales bacterium]